MTSSWLPLLGTGAAARSGHLHCGHRPPPKTKPKEKQTAKEQQTLPTKLPDLPHIKAPSAGTGAWPRQVGVHRVVWNCGNGLAAAALLASATAAGLCRVDELWGRWIKGKVPYAGIEHIRREMEDGAMDVDEDEEDEGEEDDDDL